MISGTGIEPRTYKDRLLNSTIVKIQEYRTLIVPENLDIDQLLKNNPFGTHRKKLSHLELREWLLLFIDFFYRKSIQLDITYVDSAKLKLITDNYAEMTNWLEHVNVLYIKNHSVGNRYRGYRVSDSYVGAKCVSIFIDKIIQKADAFGVRDEPDDRTGYLRPFFNHLTIRRQAISLLSREKEKYAEFIRRSKGNKDLTLHKVAIWRRAIQNNIALTFYSIQSGRFDFIPDPNTTRLYTTVSMMVRNQRPLLQYKGETLHEVDMSCAMPFLALALLYPEPYKLLHVETLIRSHAYLQKHQKEKAFNALLEKIHLGTDDVDRYRDLVASGKLYDLLMEKTKVTRREVKDQLFRAIFDKASSVTSIKKELVEEFPNVMALFDLLKTGFTKSRREGRKRGEPTNPLCMILYRLESNLFIDHIGLTFHRSYPEAPIFTVHDAIYTTSAYIQPLKQLMLEITEELYGIRPTITGGD